MVGYSGRTQLVGVGGLPKRASRMDFLLVGCHMSTSTRIIDAYDAQRSMT